MIKGLVRRLRQEGGFGLVELLIAMMIVSIAIFALVAGLSSGYLALDRAGTASTAGTIADHQLERYRALKYSDIALNSNSVDSTYTNDAAHTTTAHGEQTGCSSGANPYCRVTGCTTSNFECQATQPSYVGPDGDSYRVDTYIRSAVVPATTVTVKAVTVVVRKASNNAELVRVQSTFDSTTGS